MTFETKRRSLHSLYEVPNLRHNSAFAHQSADDAGILLAGIITQNSQLQ
jgi:hypothetical protein